MAREKSCQRVDEGQNQSKGKRSDRLAAVELGWTALFPSSMSAVSQSVAVE